VQVAEAVVPASVHVVNDPVTPVSARLTVPVGVMKVPGEVSATVTVQVDGWLTTTGVVQETVVVVARLFTTMLVVPLLLE
jgi:delta-aminolevulinic acid dehydratase/porphobilinogen synthase